MEFIYYLIENINIVFASIGISNLPIYRLSFYWPLIYRRLSVNADKIIFLSPAHACKNNIC